MRINSSTVGMESARSYTSVSGRYAKLSVVKGNKNADYGTGSLFGNLGKSDIGGETSETKGDADKKDALSVGEDETKGGLAGILDEMKSKVKAFSSGNVQDVNTEDIQKQMSDIREQCIAFLIKLLFPDRKKAGALDSEDASQVSPATMTSESLMSNMNLQTYQFSQQYYFAETESTSFSTQGTVKCADGREIDFNLNLQMSRSFEEYYEENVSFLQGSMCDPLVINLDGNIAELSDQTFLFDLDADGEADEVNRLKSGSGYLALDKNGDETINDGSELFGTASGNGFEDLRAYDSDGNGFIDEGDEIWDKLKIWTMDENGNQVLCTLAEKGVGAIGLGHASTDFSLTGEGNQTNGRIRNTGFFLYENGTAGSVQHVDMVKHDKVNNAQVRRAQSAYNFSDLISV